MGFSSMQTDYRIHANYPQPTGWGLVLFTEAFYKSVQVISSSWDKSSGSAVLIYVRRTIEPFRNYIRAARRHTDAA
jgi:hypothetical protein